MNTTQSSFRHDAAVLISFSLILLALHFTVGNGYGFHRDELQFLDDSRHLAWGYVAYPPVTSFAGRLSTSVFGVSPAAFRLPATLAGMLILTLCGLICRELGGGRRAQVLALFAALASQVILGSLMLYIVWDFLAWTLVCFFLVRLLRTEDDRWWIAVGASFGIGVLCKYSIAFLGVGILFGLVCLPSMRRSFRQPYLYLGVLAGLLIAAPNLLWEEHHGWVSIKMLSTIHARDVRLGRTAGFVGDQFKYTMLGLILALAGLIWLLRSRRFRVLAFFFVGPLVLFLIARGRGYYLLPAYIPLYAAGAIWVEDEITKRPRKLRISIRSVAFLALSLDAAAVALMMLPIAKPATVLFRYQMTSSSDMRDETGWPQFVGQIAHVRNTLPAEDLAHLGILAENYGEAGALSLYGPMYRLPAPISMVNSYFYRGYGKEDPQTVIAVGFSPDDLKPLYASCTVAAVLTTVHEQHLFDSEDVPILVCRGLRGSWATFWKEHQRFG